MILTWLQGFQDKILQLFKFLCEVPQFPKKPGYEENITKYTIYKFVLNAFKSHVRILGDVLNMTYYPNFDISVSRTMSELTFKDRN